MPKEHDVRFTLEDDHPCYVCSTCNGPGAKLSMNAQNIAQWPAKKREFLKEHYATSLLNITLADIPQIKEKQTA